MGMIPPDIIAHIPSLHTQDSLPDDHLVAYARLTLDNPRLTWFVLELHPDGDTFSAYLIDPHAERFGYFSFAYLEEHLGTPTPLAYDQHCTKKRLVDAVREERRARRAKGEGLPARGLLSPHRAYYYALSFPHDAAKEYQAVRDIVMHTPVNLSAYRIPPSTLPPFWHIVIIGDRPPHAIHERLMDAVQSGTVTIIPYDLLMQLFARKLEENAKGSHREYHRTVILKRKQKGKKKRGKK